MQSSRDDLLYDWLLEIGFFAGDLESYNNGKSAVLFLVMSTMVLCFLLSLVGAESDKGSFLHFCEHDLVYTF